MVTITKVAKLESTLKEDVEDIGGAVEDDDEGWGYHDGEYRCLRKWLEFRFPADDWEDKGTAHDALSDICNGSGWEAYAPSDPDDGYYYVEVERVL